MPSQVPLLDQQKRDIAAKISKRDMDKMISLPLFQVKWQELLQAGPTALSAMGAFFLFSSSPNASVPLKAPTDRPFSYLRYTSIQANLIECGNLGRFAFIEAKSGMSTIHLTSKVINSTINDILRCLGDPISASKLLKPQLMTVKTSATQLFESVQEIEKKFDDWISYACEMHSACVQEEQTTADLLLTNTAALAIEESRLGQQESVVAEAKAAQELLGKQVDTASEAFKKASDEYPTGWDLLAQQVVGDLAGAVTSALNQAIPAPADEYPTGWELIGQQVVVDLVNTTSARALLDSAKKRMAIAQQAFEVSSEESTVKSMAFLSKPTSANLSSTEIQAFLIDCIKLAIHLKQQIRNLVRFFKEMSNVIEVCVKDHVNPFLDTIQHLVAADGADPNQDLEIGNYSLTDYQRSVVFSAAVTLRSYFDVLGEIADIWVQLSNENIMPGLKLCDDLSTTTEDVSQMKTKFATLDEWSREAAGGVRGLCSQKQKDIMDGMDSRIEEAMYSTAMITPVPDADVTKNAAPESIELSSAKSSLSRFAAVIDSEEDD